MKNIFENFFSAPQKDAQTIIAEIHNEFDTAEDRLLKEANEILSIHKSKMTDEEKAMKLENLGFINTPIVKQINQSKTQIVKSKSEAELIQNYKLNYPFLKFLTENELNRICQKYNLIYAPVKHYIKDVPEKNVNEIHNAQSLKSSDAPKDKIRFFVKDFTSNATSDQKKQLRNGIIVNADDFGSLVWINNNEVARKYFKVDYRICTYDNINRTVEIEKRDGLFICAPKSDFDLNGLTKMNDFSYANTVRYEIPDPIVFRYCKGGVQVLSKWGLEASDEALINEINN